MAETRSLGAPIIFYKSWNRFQNFITPEPELEPIFGFRSNFDFDSGLSTFSFPCSSPMPPPTHLLPSKNNWSRDKNLIFSRAGGKAIKNFLPELEPGPDKNDFPKPNSILTNFIRRRAKSKFSPELGLQF